MDRWGGTSGLVGGDEALVGASDMPSSDCADEAVDAADLGKRSGALYESMLVVWTSSMGPEILGLSTAVVEGLCLRVPKEDFAMVLLRCGAVSPSAVWRLCFTLRVVNARAIDMLSILFGR